MAIAPAYLLAYCRGEARKVWPDFGAADEQYLATFQHAEDAIDADEKASKLALRRLADAIASVDVIAGAGHPANVYAMALQIIAARPAWDDVRTFVAISRERAKHYTEDVRSPWRAFDRHVSHYIAPPKKITHRQRAILWAIAKCGDVTPRLGKTPAAAFATFLDAFEKNVRRALRG